MTATHLNPIKSVIQPSQDFSLPSDTHDTDVHTDSLWERDRPAAKTICEKLTKPLSGTHTLQTLGYEHKGLTADEHSLEGNGNTSARRLSHLPVPNKSQQCIHMWINNFSQKQTKTGRGKESLQWRAELKGCGLYWAVWAYLMCCYSEVFCQEHLKMCIFIYIVFKKKLKTNKCCRRPFWLCVYSHNAEQCNEKREVGAGSEWCYIDFEKPALADMRKTTKKIVTMLWELPELVSRAG